MKNLVWILVMMVFIFISTNLLLSQWVQTNGPTGALISCFAVSGNNLYAGTYSGKIYLSTNNGMNWNITSTALPTNNISHVYSLSANASTLVAGTDRGVFISGNYGATWISAGLSQHDIRSVYIREGKLFANINLFNGQGGLYHSTDNGASWTPDSVAFAIGDSTGIHSIPHKSIFGSAFVEYRGGLLVGGGISSVDNGTYFTTDNGGSWTEYVSPGSDIRSLAVQGSNVFAARLFSGVYLSQDPLNPDYFFPVNSGLTDSSDVRALASNGGPILAGTYGGGIFRSDNCGASWSACNSGLTNLYVTALIYSGGSLFAGTNSGVFRSTNNGLSWTSANSGIFPPVTALIQQENYLFAGTQNCGAFVSTNNGYSWNTLSSFVNIPSFPGIEFHGISVPSLAWGSISGVGSILYAGTEAGVFRSTNHGTNWDGNGIPGNYVSALVIDPSNIAEAFAGTSSGVYSTADYGINWSVRGLTDTKVNAISVKGQYVIVGTSKGIYFANDPGLRDIGYTGYIFWIPTWSDPVSALYVSGNNIFQGTSTGVYVSDDGGVGWIQRNSGLINKEYVKAFTLRENNLFAATLGGGVFLSTNNGITWNGVNTGLKETDVSSLTVSDNFLYVGTNWGGVWRRPLSEMVTSVEKQHEKSPTKFELDQNYPNPFNPATNITFSLPLKSFVSLKIFDALGREMSTLVFEELSAGVYSRAWNGKGFPSGIYFYRLETGSFTKTKKLVLLR